MILPTLALLAALTAITDKDGKECAAAFQDAIVVNIRPECREYLAPIVAAIRYAENGGPGREYGILHARVKPTYRSQAGWCAATVQKTWDRWSGTEGFITYLGARYCPVGADNDPKGLNRHWVGNVTKFTKRFRGQTMSGEKLAEDLITKLESDDTKSLQAFYLELKEARDTLNNRLAMAQEEGISLD